VPRKQRVASVRRPELQHHLRGQRGEAGHGKAQVEPTVKEVEGERRPAQSRREGRAELLGKFMRINSARERKYSPHTSPNARVSRSENAGRRIDGRRAAPAARIRALR